MVTEKEKILVIAPQIPVYDRASGDLRFFTILKLLSEKYKIIFLALDEHIGEEFQRYNRELENLGATIYVKEFSLRNILKQHQCSAVFFEFYFTAEYYLNIIRVLQPDCPIIIDSVDIHFHREHLKYELTGNLKDLEKAVKTKKRELTMYRKADLVVAITEEDADIIRKEAPEIQMGVLSNIHDVVGLGHETRDRKKLIFIGGFKHQPNIDAVEYFCEDVFPLVLKKHPEMELDIIGSNIPEDFEKYANNHVHLLGYVPSVTPYLHKSYISIAPLRYGAGMKGKIGEAMAHGSPIVTTPIGVQGLALKHREHIMVANTSQDFASCILELTKDDVLYASMAKKSLEYIEDHFTPEKIRDELFDLLETIASKPVRKMTILAKGKVLLTHLLTVLYRRYVSVIQLR